MNDVACMINFSDQPESSVDTNDTKVTIEFCRCDETF